MALRKVVIEGDDILRKKCREVGQVTDRIRETMEDMKETMRAEMGVGIAAPQIGVMRRMFERKPAGRRGMSERTGHDRHRGTSRLYKDRGYRS